MSANLAEVPKQGPPVRMSLLDVPGFHFSPVGLKIDDWVDFETWMSVGRALEIAGMALQWYFGDWLTHGEKKWGEKYAQALDAHKKTGIPVDTLRNYQWVAERVPFVTRVTNLDWSSHREVATLPQADQKQVLQKAIKGGWTSRGIKRYVETGLEPGERSEIDASALAMTIGSIQPGSDLQTVANYAMVQFLLEAKQTVGELKTKCPRPKFVTDVLGSWDDELNDHLEQLDLVVLKDKVIQAWKAGNRQEKQIAAATGIPEREMHGVMMAYKREGLFEKIVRSKTAMAKGTPPWIWHLVGEPLGSSYQPERAA